jgi:hypothetical protein
MYPHGIIDIHQIERVSVAAKLEWFSMRVRMNRKPYIGKGCTAYSGLTAVSFYVHIALRAMLDLLILRTTLSLTLLRGRAYDQIFLAGFFWSEARSERADVYHYLVEYSLPAPYMSTVGDRRRLDNA